jgi:DNA repair protein RecN (Recombination protein N)
MLEILKIKNLALIEDMELEFHPGLNVLTGESGAGKSFILKALDFIMGEKIQASMVRPGTGKAMVEAMFILDDQELILKRELVAETGRSRFFLNDSLTSQDKVQSLRDNLMIHTSQHGQQKLLKPGFHGVILDSFLPDESLLVSKNQILGELLKLSAEKKTIEARLSSLSEKREYLEFQRSQIEKVKPLKGEEEQLINAREKIKIRSELAQAGQKALDIMHSPGINLLGNFYELKKAVDYLGENEPGFAPFAVELENVQALFVDIDRSLRSINIQSDVMELESVESRLWELAQLRRKLNRSLEEILLLGQEIDDNISFLDQGELSLMQLKKREEKLAKELSSITGKLDNMRENKAQELKNRLEDELRTLGFSEHMKIEFEFRPEEIYPGIFEKKLRLLWIPNPGQPAQPLDKIASGGELSRFLLALVGLKSEQGLPTLLFDEVDSGIGGTILNQVGQRIKNLALDRQVILITHWPQLACQADRHFLVQKNVIHSETYTLCQGLSARESKRELARMAGGDHGLKLVAELKNETSN